MPSSLPRNPPPPAGPEISGAAQPALRSRYCRTPRPAAVPESPHQIPESAAAAGGTQPVTTGSSLRSSPENSPPETSLATLLADLEKTEIFMKYREGRDHLDHRRNEAAEECFRFIVARAPQNIVFRVYLARAIAQSDRYWPSVYHYKLALRFGARRRPQQLLLGVRKEMDQLRRRLRPVWSRIRDCFVGKPAEFIPDPADEMIAQLNRSLTRAARELPSSGERRRLK